MNNETYEGAKENRTVFPWLSPLGRPTGSALGVVIIRAGGRSTLQSITQTAQCQMSISSPSTALEHPDIAGREEIISELEGASLLLPQS
jgi:hypothetical protein